MIRDQSHSAMRSDVGDREYGFEDCLRGFENELGAEEIRVNGLEADDAVEAIDEL